jgi:hypothetical protein
MNLSRCNICGTTFRPPFQKEKELVCPSCIKKGYWQVHRERIADIVSEMDNALYKNYFQIMAAMLHFDFEEFFIGMTKK